MKKQEITLEGRRKIQLDMLQQIHNYCTANGIRYMLAFGTLLGAIRHKGFIPWDDDVDIMMPNEDLDRFVKGFCTESYGVAYYTNEPIYMVPFPRAYHKLTYNKVGVTARSYGINIDVYIVCGLPQDEVGQQALFSAIRSVRTRRLTFNRWAKRLLRYLPINKIPGLIKCQQMQAEITRRYPMKESDCVFICPDFNIYPQAWFDNYMEVDFEGLRLQAPAAYHEYLTAEYGDYMQLPPEEKRVPYHESHYYWK